MIALRVARSAHVARKPDPMEGIAKFDRALDWGRHTLILIFNVRVWPIADIPSCTALVCFWG